MKALVSAARSELYDPADESGVVEVRAAVAEKELLKVKVKHLMNRVGFVYDEVFLNHKPPAWHPDSPDRLTNIILTLKASGIWPRLIPLHPRRATLDDIGRVHTREYIEKIRTFGAGELDPDTYLSEGSFDAALHAAGAVMEAV